MITCNDCIHNCVCPLADGTEYRDIDNIQADCEYFAQKTERKWISVDERLPDPKEYDWVLVNVMFNEDGTYGVPQIAELRNGEWWNGDFKISDLYETVTHWMPLPSYPTKNN